MLASQSNIESESVSQSQSDFIVSVWKPLSDYIKKILSPDDIHLAFGTSKRSETKRWDPIESENHGWFSSGHSPKSVPGPKSKDRKEPEIPWNRSKATDRVLFEALTNQILYDLVEENFRKNSRHMIGWGRMSMIISLKLCLGKFSTWLF